MKSNTKIFMPFVIAILLGSLTFVFGQSGKNDFSNSKAAAPREGRMPPPPDGFNPRILDRLNLTDAQRTEIGKLHDKSRTDSQVYFEKMQVAQEKLKDIIESGTFDEAQARQIIASKTSAMTELEVIRLRTDMAIRNLLTAEQIAQMDLLKSQRPDFPPPPGFRPDGEHPQN
jgi:Spy/CpxP family protein refolding chaperone